jgi:molybdopterin synthase catalytic subunit
MIGIRITPDDFDAGAELARLETGAGAVASFIGVVRGDDGLAAMTLEHYPAMTEKAVSEIAAEAERRWPIIDGMIIHRVGRLEAGARIVLVAVASRHRQAALEACAFLIDWLKTRAPFWKIEEFADGRKRWVEARTEDDAAASKWLSPPR